MIEKIKLNRTRPDKHYPDYKGYQIICRRFKFYVYKDNIELEWLFTLYAAKEWIDKREKKNEIYK